MDTILNNITDPSWWFTGMFFVLIAYVLPKAIRVISTFPVHAEGLRRKLKLKLLRKIKGIRFDDTKVLIEAVKASTWQVIFILALLVFFYSYLTEPTVFSVLSGGEEKQKTKGLVIFVLSSPIYIIEVIYVLQAKFLEKLMKYREKLRIASGSSGSSGRWR